MKTMVMVKARWLDNNLLFPFSFSFFLIVLCFSVSPDSVSLYLCSSASLCSCSLCLWFFYLFPVSPSLSVSPGFSLCSALFLGCVSCSRLGFCIGFCAMNCSRSLPWCFIRPAFYKARDLQKTITSTYGIVAIMAEDMVTIWIGCTGIFLLNRLPPCETEGMKNTASKRCRLCV
ncbi:hypothetical protein NC652_027123 [Populus alba x Populus x berolinensis]|nr:hypothetical protein NC652_027123 [Populus alba x Populus x berolinensis]